MSDLIPLLGVAAALIGLADGGTWSVAMAVAQAATNGLVLVPAIRWWRRPAWSRRT